MIALTEHTANVLAVITACLAFLLLADALTSYLRRLRRKRLERRARSEGGPGFWPTCADQWVAESTHRLVSVAHECDREAGHLGVCRCFCGLVKQ